MTDVSPYGHNENEIADELAELVRHRRLIDDAIAALTALQSRCRYTDSRCFEYCCGRKG